MQSLGMKVMGQPLPVAQSTYWSGERHEADSSARANLSPCLHPWRQDFISKIALTTERRVCPLPPSRHGTDLADVNLCNKTRRSHVTDSHLMAVLYFRIA